MAEPMPEESQDELEQQAMSIAMADLQNAPVNSALRWYSWIVKLMPAILTFMLPFIFSVVIRLPLISRYQLDGDWLALAYVIILLLSTFVLGFVHARIKRAISPSDRKLQDIALSSQAVDFFLKQLLFAPAVLVAIIVFFMLLAALF